MRRTGIRAAAILTAACLGAAGMTGCGSKKYEEITISSEQAGEEAASEAEADVLASSENEADLAKATAVSYTFTEVSDIVYVTGSNVRLRSSADTSSSANVVTTLGTGTKLTRTGDSDKWCRVSYNGQTAYISKDFVSTTEPVTEAPTEAPTAAALEAIQAPGSGSAGSQMANGTAITLNSGWTYAGNSAIHTGAAVLYKSTAANAKGITVCVNAGHGTSGGGSVKTLCHPDGSAKVTGGSTGAGATKATAVAGGMTFQDGTPESKVTLAMAMIFKQKLLDAGYDVVMIRESDDVQLDNIARTVIANNTSDCHIALHWDSTTSNKGAFFMSVPNIASYRAMEPVASHWQQHNTLGTSLVNGLKGAGVKIFGDGTMGMDLTQTSYSTVPSVDIELGDGVSDHSAGTLDTLATGLVAGVNAYFGK